MPKSKMTLAQIMYEQEEKDIENAINTLNKIAQNKSMSEKNQTYDVGDLYILTTYRKINADFETIRYITEYFVGIKDTDNYYELFSNVCLDMLEGQEPPVFDRLFVSKVEPLSQYVANSTIEKQDVFYFIVKLNALDRCALDVTNAEE